MTCLELSTSEVSGTYDCNYSITEMATSSQPCLPSCCHCLKAKLIAQLVGHLGLAKLELLLQLSQGWSLPILPEDYDSHQRLHGLSLPAWIERKFGRLVDFMALQSQTTSCTRVDVSALSGNWWVWLDHAIVILNWHDADSHITYAPSQFSPSSTGWAYLSQFIIFSVLFKFQTLQHLPTSGTNVAFPFGRLTALHN